MKLYFGSAVTAATTLMILALLGFIGYSAVNHAGIQYWGRRSAILLVFGLVVCASRRPVTALTKPFSPPLMAAARPVCFRWSACLPLWAASARH